MLIQEYKYLSNFFDQNQNEDDDEVIHPNLHANYIANNLIRIISTKYAEYTKETNKIFCNFNQEINILKNNIEHYFLNNYDKIVISNEEELHFSYTFHKDKLPEFKFVNYIEPTSNNEFIILNLDTLIQGYFSEKNILLSNCIKLFLVKSIPMIVENNLYDLEIDKQGHSWPVFYCEDSIFDYFSKNEDSEEKLISIFENNDNSNLFFEMYIPKDKDKEIKFIVSEKSGLNFGLNIINNNSDYSHAIIFPIKEWYCKKILTPVYT